MSTITRERVAQYANDPRMCNVNDEIRKIARIALASLEAEAVAWRYRFVHTPKSEEHGSPFTTDWVLAHSEDECNPSDCFERQPLFTAPPAPVSVPDENGLLPCPCCGGNAEFDYDDDNLNWISCNVCGISTDTAYHTDVDARDKLREVWNRRAAILQGAERVNNRDKLPEVVLHMGQAMSVFEALKKEVLHEHVRHAELGAMGAVNVQVWTSVLGGTLQYETSNGGCTLRVTQAAPQQEVK